MHALGLISTLTTVHLSRVVLYTSLQIVYLEMRGETLDQNYFRM